MQPQLATDHHGARQHQQGGDQAEEFFIEGFSPVDRQRHGAEEADEQAQAQQRRVPEEAVAVMACDEAVRPQARPAANRNIKVMVGMYTPWKAISRGMVQSFGRSQGRLGIEQGRTNEMQVALHPTQHRGVEVPGEGFVGGLHAADGMVNRHQGAFVVAGVGLQEQPRQGPAHHADGLAPGLAFGIGRVDRGAHLFLAQLDDRVADFGTVNIQRISSLCTCGRPAAKP